MHGALGRRRGGSAVKRLDALPAGRSPGRGTIGLDRLTASGFAAVRGAGYTALQLHNCGSTMQRLLIVLGAILLGAGLFWPWLSKLPFGRLPGDINIQRENFSFHFPLMTSILLSLLLTLILWLWRK
jgi:hypothetical protein